MQLVMFLKEFIKHPRYTGAIAPSSPKLAKEMVSQIDFQTAKCIVELGPGTGVFTKEMMKNKKSETQVILVEINEIFAKDLQREYANEPNVHVIEGSAENLQALLEELHIKSVDCIISGLPFTSLPSEVSSRILTNIKNVLLGKFITFQYSLVKKAFFQAVFTKTKCRKIWLNIPPAYVFICEK
ncbi:class I SAM-dependent methyltransferase [Bacillus chungangensis]|uniref:class I SAM-dependent methyltransferase n=1 Tax=Bacillus chungangensis TaxID=587633 RepID=UPI0027D7CE0A|nr:rRNA adenine N-6-methyltransferase family protein [Bacillus chungangensis]